MPTLILMFMFFCFCFVSLLVCLFGWCFFFCFAVVFQVVIIFVLLVFNLLLSCSHASDVNILNNSKRRANAESIHIHHTNVTSLK